MSVSGQFEGQVGVQDSQAFSESTYGPQFLERGTVYITGSARGEGLTVRFGGRAEVQGDSSAAPVRAFQVSGGE